GGGGGPPASASNPAHRHNPAPPPAPAEATTPNPRPSLPVTGGDVSLASVLAVSALAIGAILSIVVRWRRRYDRFKHWTMRWPIR
ncbi:cell surface protein, partial [Bifidobacterium longum subsp. infantis]